MKRIITYTLSFLLLAQALGLSVVYMGYWVNKSYISQNFCINKTDVKKQCQGKCHLAKQLDKQEKQEATNTRLSKEKQEYCASVDVGCYFPVPFSTALTDHKTILKEKKYQSPDILIFQPPRV